MCASLSRTTARNSKTGAQEEAECVLANTEKVLPLDLEPLLGDFPYFVSAHHTFKAHTNLFFYCLPVSQFSPTFPHFTSFSVYQYLQFPGLLVLYCWCMGEYHGFVFQKGNINNVNKRRTKGNFPVKA